MSDIICTLPSSLRVFVRLTDVQLDVVTTNGERSIPTDLCIVDRTSIHVVCLAEQYRRHRGFIEVVSRVDRKILNLHALREQ